MSVNEFVGLLWHSLLDLLSSSSYLSLSLSIGAMFLFSLAGLRILYIYQARYPILLFFL